MKTAIRVGIYGTEGVGKTTFASRFPGAVFIDTERDCWGMDPIALEKAFELYPDVRLVVIAHLYGTPGKMDELKSLFVIATVL